MGGPTTSRDRIVVAFTCFCGASVLPSARLSACVKTVMDDPKVVLPVVFRLDFYFHIVSVRTPRLKYSLKRPALQKTFWFRQMGCKSFIFPEPKKTKGNMFWAIINSRDPSAPCIWSFGFSISIFDSVRTRPQPAAFSRKSEKSVRLSRFFSLLFPRSKPALNKKTTHKWHEDEW